LLKIINRRYEIKSALVPTNRPFDEWDQIFPNAAYAVSLVDQLIHFSDIIVFEANSYPMKEATEKKKTAGRKPLNNLINHLLRYRAGHYTNQTNQGSPVGFTLDLPG
jgi:hypothetical protein